MHIQQIHKLFLKTYIWSNVKDSIFFNINFIQNWILIPKLFKIVKIFWLSINYHLISNIAILLWKSHHILCSLIYWQNLICLLKHLFIISKINSSHKQKQQKIIICIGFFKKNSFDYKQILTERIISNFQNKSITRRKVRTTFLINTSLCWLWPRSHRPSLMKG